LKCEKVGGGKMAASDELATSKFDYTILMI